MTDDEIRIAVSPLFGTSDALNFAMKTSIDEYRAIIAAYQDKLLAGVEMPEPVADLDYYCDEYGPSLTFMPKWYESLDTGLYHLFTPGQLQSYAAAAALNARNKALEEVKHLILSALRNNVLNS